MKLLHSLAISMAFLFLTGCASLKPITSAQALQSADPIVTNSLGLVLRNNVKDIPIAQAVGTDLATSNFTDLTTLGINALVAKVAAKYTSDPVVLQAIQQGLDGGITAYLLAVNETDLTSDPNAQLVLQHLGTDITGAATWALANPK